MVKKSKGNKSTPSVAELQIAEFLDHVLPPGVPGKIIIKLSLKAKPRLFGDALSAAKFALRENKKGKNIYFSLGKTLGGSNTDSEVPCASVLWADFDCDVDEQRVDTLDLLLNPGEFPPSAIYRSVTGFHGYWLLAEPLDSFKIKHLNTALSEKLGGCSGMNKTPSAILRLPYTRIHPTKKYGSRTGVSGAVEVVHFNVSLKYTLEDIEEYLHIEYPARTEPAEWVADNRLLQVVLSKMEKVKIVNGEKVSGCCFFGDRHPDGEDSNPSAVVFNSGRYYCSGCNLSEPFSLWSKRPEVSSWATKLTPPKNVGGGEYSSTSPVGSAYAPARCTPSNTVR